MCGSVSFGELVSQDLEEMHPKNPNVVADMTALHHIHEPGILHNLKERSRPWRQTPYTFMVRIAFGLGGKRPPPAVFATRRTGARVALI